MYRGDVATLDRLSALDAVFLAIENDRYPMHIGLTAVFEKGRLRTPTGALDGAEIRRYVRAVLASLPKFRRRLARIPVLLRPVLVDDDGFDLDHHVRFLALASGEEAELCQLAERIYSERLDRRRPLWELWVIDGLSGDRFAIVTKAHHCLVDGVSGIAALTAMLRATPDAAFDDAVPPHVEPPPRGRDLLITELRRLVARPARPTLPDARRVARTLVSGLAHAAWSSFPRASDTSLQPSAPGARRSIAWLDLPLREVKAVKEAASAKMNDVVLATVSGALSRLVARHAPGDAGRRFRALVPVSLHAAADAAVGNEVSLLLVPLPVSEPDPKERLRLVSERMKAEKASGEVEAIGTAERLADTWSFGLVTATARLAILFRPYNLIVTNIRGPEVPLYLLGSRLLGIFPLVPSYGKDTLGVALVSYDDKLCWGLSGDVAGGDLGRFADDVRASFEALRRSALDPTFANGA
jgi:diacylglycerol O-acyltransferase / wax synthase